MKYSILLVLLLACTAVLNAQLPPRVNPVIKSQGAVFEIPFAVEKPDPTMVYNIIIECEREGDRPDTVNWALNNVARLLNIFASSGVPTRNVNVILAIHGPASYSAMDNEAYKAKYGKDNPNLKLYQELQGAGIKMYLCGQSVVNRRIDRNKLVPEVKIATSMLTTVSTYQLKGFAYLKF